MISRRNVRSVLCIGLAILLVSQGQRVGAAGTLSPSPRIIVTTSSGAPINGACIWTYLAGTSTPTTTWTDKALSVANGNPVIATVGLATIYLQPGISYKYIVENIPCNSGLHGAVLYSQDNIDAVPGSSSAVDVLGTAGESISAGQAVYLSDGSGGKSAGQWYKADTTNTYSSSLLSIGMAPAAITSAAIGTVRISGQVTGLSSLTVGGLYYVGVAGAITTTAPTNTRIIGQADSTSTLILTGDPPPAFASALTNHGVLIGKGAGVSPTATAAMTTGQLLVGVTGGDPVPAAAAGAGASMVLLKANSGTDASAGATNVDTIAITGLTAKDMLYVKLVAKSATAATANIGLYNSTDSVALNNAVASLAGGETLMIDFHAAQSQASATSIDTRAEGKDTVPTLYGSIVIAAFTQNWTGSWTLALRHGGVTAGGTLQWRWSVYRLVGQ